MSGANTIHTEKKCRHFKQHVIHQENNLWAGHSRYDLHAQCVEAATTYSSVVVNVSRRFLRA